MAVTGAIIVMAGLSMLATIISQLHRIIAFFDRRKGLPTPPETGAKTNTELKIDLLNDLPAAAAICRAITADLGDGFELTKLYERMKQENQPHAHLTIRSLREAGYLIKIDGDRFNWKAI